MINIRDILKMRYETDDSLRSIARQTGCNSHNTVTNILDRAETAGLSWPLPDGLGNEELEKLLYPGVGTNIRTVRDRPLPDMLKIKQELSIKRVTRQLLWKEYKAEHPDGLGYSRFNDHFRKWQQIDNAEFRIPHKAGDKLFVDWAGDKMSFINRATGEIIEVSLFVAAMGASSKIYCEPRITEKTPEWIECHVNALEFFGGAPAALVPDNLKTGITKPDWINPQVATAYREMARYYDIAVIPARPRKPQDKPKVETSVQIIEREIIAALRNEEFFSFDAICRAVKEKNATINARNFSKARISRDELFLQTDKPQLKPLPSVRYEYAEWKQAKVHKDYHIQFADNFYSVPARLLYQKVDLRATAKTVEVFYKDERVASHQRCHGKFTYITNDNHRPANHQQYIKWTTADYSEKLSAIGENVFKLVGELMKTRLHPEQTFRQIQGIISLAKRYGNERTEAASIIALDLKCPRYKNLKTILENNRDLQPQSQPKEQTSVVSHSNIRGQEYFRQEVLALC